MKDSAIIDRKNISINNEGYPLKVRSLKWTDEGYIPTSDPYETTVGTEVKMVYELVWNDSIDTVSFDPKTTPTELFNMVKDNLMYELERFYIAQRYQSFMDYAFTANSAIDYLWHKMDMTTYYDDKDDSSNKFIF